VGGGEEVDGRVGPGVRPHEPVHGVLVAGHGADELLHLRWGRREPGQVGGHLVHRPHGDVAGALVGAHRVVVGLRPGERRRQRSRAQVRIAEGVADPLRGDEVTGVAGVTDQGPTRPERAAEEVRDRRPHDAGLPATGLQAVGERRRHLQGPQVGALEIGLVHTPLHVGPTGDHHGQVVVGLHSCEAAFRADEGLEPSAGGHTAPVGVVAAQQRRLLVVTRRTGGAGDHRVDAVGADDDPSPFGDRRAAAVPASHTGDPPVVHEDLVDREVLPHLGPGRRRGLDEQRVENRPSWRVGHRLRGGPG
jgi:hypothetical protein